MNRKRIICLAICLIPATLFGQTNSRGGTFTISGKVRGGDGRQIYLLSSLETSPKDSMVIQHESFHFSMKGDTTLYAIILQGAQSPVLVIALPGKLLINTDTSAYPIGEVHGQRENEAMQLYQKDFRGLSQRAISLNREAQGISEADTEMINSFRKKADIFNNEVKKAGEQFLITHRAYVASLFVLMNELRTRLSPSAMKKEFSLLSPAVRQTKFGIAAGEYIKEVNFDAIGDLAPDFTQTDTSGKQISLSSYRGKYVLVDFWASWCHPCREENPNVVAAFHQFSGKNFAILSVSLDNKRANWLDAIRSDGLDWTQVSDLQGWNNAVAVQYRITSIPSNLLIGPDGRILAKNIRGEVLFNTLQSVLK
ncbi:MAG TPA: TlpA disulfide reductase family protein [Chitinophagaceae bacterium]|nr:TlpA disulfide reductase family protein [Chitinophagaceae bacterium]